MAGIKFFERGTIRPLRDLVRAAWFVGRRLAGLGKSSRRSRRRSVVRREGRAPEGADAPIGSGPPRSENAPNGHDREAAAARARGGLGEPGRSEQVMVERLSGGNGPIAGSSPVTRSPAPGPMAQLPDRLRPQARPHVPPGQAPWRDGGVREPEVEGGVVIQPGAGAEDDRGRVAAPSEQGPDEGLGELPWAYGDDSFIALPRDPTTLWLMWDFAQATVESARQGLESPKVRLRLFDEGGLVRELDLALESGSFYVHDLPPGRRYRAELLVVGRNGARRIGREANEVGLPRRGPSAEVDDRFATLPWGLPLDRGLDLFAHGMSFPAIPGTERGALYAASRPGLRLGGSESLVGASPSGSSWFSGPKR